MKPHKLFFLSKKHYQCNHRILHSATEEMTQEVHVFKNNIITCKIKTSRFEKHILLYSLSEITNLIIKVIFFQTKNDGLFHKLNIGAF